MLLIQFSICLYLFLIFLYQSECFNSIQCCTGDDNTCSSKPVDCPSNVCFKLVISKITEERGCLDDLIKLLNIESKTTKKLNDENSLTSGSTIDECHRLGTYGNGMSLCKCTSNLCNHSIQLNQHYLLITNFILISFILS